MSGKKIFFLISLCFISFYGCSGKSSLPVAEKGVLDLRSWDFAGDGSVVISGEWEFHWKEFLDPEFYKNTTDEEPVYFNMPAEWNWLKIKDKPLTGKGFATLRLSILHNSGEHLALSIPRIYTAYRIYINGVLAGKAGIPGKTEYESKPQYMPQVIYFDPSPERMELVLHISNFHHVKGGLSRSKDLLLGPEKNFDLLHDYKTIINYFLLGSFLVIGIFHLLLFLQRTEEIHYLYFAATCFVTLLWILLYEEKIIYHILSDVSWPFLVRIEYITNYLQTLFYMLFIYYFYKNDFSVKVRNIVSTFLVSLIALTLLFPLSPVISAFHYFYHPLTATAFLYCSYVLIKIMKKGDSSDRIFAAGYLITLAGVIYTVIIYSQLAASLIYHADLIPYFMFFLIVINALYLAGRHSRALKVATEFSRELEQEVGQRTAQLKQSNEIIRKTNDEQKELLRLLCHDLTSPFLSMKSLLGLVENTPERFKNNRELFFREVKSSIQTSLELIKRVRDLIEADEIEITPVPVNVSESVNLAEMIIKDMLNQKAIELVKDIDPSITVSAEPGPFVHSILINIIVNAVKFSDQGSGIFISANELQGRVVIKIADKGIGMPEAMVNDFMNNRSLRRRRGTAGEKGSGFGLALMRKFVWYYGGEINITSRSIDEHPEEHGTTIILDMKSGAAAG